MGSRELAKLWAKRIWLPQTIGIQIFSVLMDVMKETILDGKTVSLWWIWKLDLRFRPWRNLVHPRTKKKMRSNDTKVLRFKVSKRFNDKIKKTFIY